MGTRDIIFSATNIDIEGVLTENELVSLNYLVDKLESSIKSDSVGSEHEG